MGSYDPTIYFEIFGAEYGWILYREIKLRIHADNSIKIRCCLVLMQANCDQS